MRLKFEIKQQQMHRTDHEIPVNKSHDYLKAEFNFLTSEWVDLSKIALFKIPLKNGKEKVYAKSLGSSDVSTVIVPHEVLQGTVFKVAVFAGDLITTNESIIYLKESGYTKDISSTSNPSPDIFSDMMSKIASKYDNIEFDGKELIISSDGVIKKRVNIEQIQADWVEEDEEAYSFIKNKPTSFNPSPHTHDSDEVVDFDDELNDFLIGITRAIYQL